MQQLRVDVNARPWAPAVDAKILVEFDRHDVPLAGVVEQAGQRYLFTCLVGEMSDDGIWAFVPISPDDEVRIGELRGEAVDAAILEQFRHKMITLVGAVANQVVFAGRVDTGEESPRVWIDRFLSQWQNYITGQQSAMSAMGEPAFA